MPKITVRDTDLYFDTVGHGEISLLFIHGMCGGAWDWEDQMSRLSREFTCVAYDRRGHTRSDAGTKDQSNRTHTDDAAALIDALGLDRPVIVGDSDGGAIAVELLCSHPDRVRGAVLSEPPIFSLVPGAGEQLVAEVSPSIEQATADAGPRAAVDAFFSMVCPGFWAQIDEAVKDSFRDNAPMLFASLEHGAAGISAADLASIDVPALVMTGADSHPVLRCITQTLAGHLPDARFIEIEDSGHVTFAEQPEQFAQATRAFVNEIAGTVNGAQ